MKNRRRKPKKVRNDDTNSPKMVTVYSYDDFISQANDNPDLTPAFYLKENIDLFLVCLHSAFDNTGELKPSVKEIVKNCNTYAEAIPDGLRLYVRGRLPNNIETNYVIDGGVRVELIDDGFLGIPKNWIDNPEPNPLMDYMKQHKLFCFGEGNEPDGFTSKAELEAKRLDTSQAKHEEISKC